MTSFCTSVIARVECMHCGVWKGNFYKLLNRAQEKAFTSANILCVSRLWPVDLSIVKERVNFGRPDTHPSY